MSTNPPASESSRCPLRSSQPASQTDPPVLHESEAMRRMQDLLKAKKVSISDTVVFEYNHHSFAAEIMSDGSLKSKHQPLSNQHLNSSPAAKLYSSPSEFASDMAACTVPPDEKVTRPRGKISINGWSNCTVNGKALATIRNEMLHERKNENANVSKDKVQEPVSMSIGDTPHEPDTSSRAIGVFSKHMTACHEPSSHDLENPTKFDQENSKDPGHPAFEPRREDAFTSREVNETNSAPNLDFERSHDAVQQPPGDGDNHSESSSQYGSDRDMAPTDADMPIREVKPQQGKGKVGKLNLGRILVAKKPSPEESSMKNLFPENNKESAGSSLTINLGGNLREVPGVKRQSNTNMIESAKRELELKEIPPFSKNPEQVNRSKKDISLNKERNLKESANEYMDAEETVMPSPKCDDEPRQGIVERDGKLGSSTGRVQETKNLKETNRYDNISPANDQGGPVARMESKAESCGDDDEMEEEIVASSEPVETKESPQQDRAGLRLASSQFQDLKEVSDLQQEILGDSDSDEESFTAVERRPGTMLKKRSHSPSFHSSKKIKRMGRCGSLEAGEGTATEGFHKTAQKEGSDQGPRMERTVGTEIERTQLDPETMEAAAIAAQIEKEEASNRARRTTRLAAGKIKQVDYKATAATQVPRSMSSGPGSEENERNANDNDFPADATRTTRRRSISNQFYSSQRSSRRVAKLRNSQEKEQSSNDETENHAARTSLGGNGSENRSDKDAVCIEDAEAAKGQGSRPSCVRPDGNDRRRGRPDICMKRARHAYHDEGDHDSQGRAYSTRASTRENSVADAAEITDLGDPSDFPSESEDAEDDDSIGDRCNDYGFTAADLESFAEAVKASNSVHPAAVIASLGEQESWKADDMKNQEAEAFLREMINRVQCLSPQSLGSTPWEVNIGQVLSFLSAEIWRLSTGGLITGVPRKPKAVVKKAAREDQVRSTLERSRRKEHRDVEEMRGTLEKEMESRRRAELDTLYIEIQVSEVSRAALREKARCSRVEQETEKYRDMEVDNRKKLEQAKILVGQLQGENNESEGANGSKVFHQDETLRLASEPNGSFERGPVHARTKSATSDDEVEMMDKNITTTSQRLLEMDRLRVLIAAREAEAEEFQRICEKERMRFVNTLELKNRLETEIYLYRSHGAVAYCTGNSSVVPPSNRQTKENLKKGDHRLPSAYGNRGSGYARQKSGVGKNVGSVPPVANHKNNVSASRLKSGIGRPSEAPKVAKRKPAVKNSGSGSDKM